MLQDVEVIGLHCFDKDGCHVPTIQFYLPRIEGKEIYPLKREALKIGRNPSTGLFDQFYFYSQDEKSTQNEFTQFLPFAKEHHGDVFMLKVDMTKRDLFHTKVFFEDTTIWDTRMVNQILKEFRELARGGGQ